MSDGYPETSEPPARALTLQEALDFALRERDEARAQRDGLAVVALRAVEGLDVLGLQDPDRRMQSVARELADALPPWSLVEDGRRWEWPSALSSEAPSSILFWADAGFATVVNNPPAYPMQWVVRLFFFGLHMVVGGEILAVENTLARARMAVPHRFARRLPVGERLGMELWV